MGAWLERLKQGEPLAYILGNQGFHEIELKVDRRVLIPRPETELLVERGLEHLRNNRPQQLTIVDVGTGSGAIVLALLRSVIRDQLCAVDAVRGFAIDLEQDALDVAKANAEALGLARFVTFLQSDLLNLASTTIVHQALQEIGTTRVVLANLPYIGENDHVEESVKRFEPGSALWAGNGGLSLIYRLIDEIAALSVPGIWLGLEVGAGQAAKVESHVLRLGFEGVARARDFAGIERVVTGSYERVSNVRE
jgi:release factor glutamine methyltransferase